MYQLDGPTLQERDLGSYLAMRMAAAKPATEERHARHIQRYYACRGLHKLGFPELFVLPAVTGPDGPYRPDVVGRRGGELTFVYCATWSLTELPRGEIDRLVSVPDGPKVMVITSNTLDVPSLQAEFAERRATGRLSVRVMTLPPFDDVLEYDIWMFEMTFQEVGP